MGNTLLKVLEQLLHKIKAKRRREIISRRTRGEVSGMLRQRLSRRHIIDVCYFNEQYKKYAVRKGIFHGDENML